MNLRHLLAGLVALAALGGGTVNATDYGPTTTSTVPADPCRYNGNIPADDPTCPPPCQYNPELAADDPYCEPTETTWPASTAPGTTSTTSTAPASTSTLPASTTAVPGPTSTSTLPTSSTTQSPVSGSPTTSSAPSSVVSVAPPPTVCDPALEPTCNRLPTTGSSNYTIVPWAIVLACLGGMLVLVARRQEAA